MRTGWEVSLHLYVLRICYYTYNNRQALVPHIGHMATAVTVVNTGEDAHNYRPHWNPCGKKAWIQQLRTLSPLPSYRKMREVQITFYITKDEPWPSGMRSGHTISRTNPDTIDNG